MTRMLQKCIYRDLGLIDFKDAWVYQEKIFSVTAGRKAANRILPEAARIPTDNYLLLCEHPHVYTLGKSGSSKNLLVDEMSLKRIGAKLLRIDRGGDITYHGPGQLVGYPILDMESLGMHAKKYVFNLEEVIIHTLKYFGLKGERLDGASGVWLDVSNPGQIRKICAIGVKISRGVCMHGFALNIATNLKLYENINPCGFTDKKITTMAAELNGNVDFADVKQKVIEKFGEIFKMQPIEELF